MRVTNITAAWVLCAAFAWPALAQDTHQPDEPLPGADAEEQSAPPADDFKYQTGNVVLPNKVATLNLGQRYRYLDPAETSRLLVAWGNPPFLNTQGAVVPAEVSPLSAEAWAVIIQYKDDGHVDDSDAKDIDYDELLENMQSEQKDSNAARKQAGYDALTLVGWAEPPHYDATEKRLYWAKHITSDRGGASLNYDVRLLSREGVLSMEAVAPMDQLDQVKKDMVPLMRTVAFNEGYRYAEFNKDTDRVAEYGLATLIAGAAAAKLGLFAKIGAFLLPLKKFIILGFVAIGGLFAKLFGRKKEQA